MGAPATPPREEASQYPLFGNPYITQKTIDFLGYCVDFLLAHGITEQGIFRVPGEGELVKKLKEAFNKEASLPDTDFTRLALKKAHVSEVASLFKLFFREMPDSLLTHELYDCFISVYGMPPEHRPHVLSRVVCLLEPERLRILEILLIFLRELAKASDKTLMNAHNLAIVFAPNILRSGTDNPGQVITDAKATLEIVHLLLIDPSITQQSAETKKVEETPQRQSEFRKTMQENYLAIRKDSTRKLEQVSRKSRVSQTEFTKKMEVLSQKILDGELDPNIFDEAANKFMDPALIAQFAGQESPMAHGVRANRHNRNAHRGGFAITSPTAASEEQQGLEDQLQHLTGSTSPPPPSASTTTKSTATTTTTTTTSNSSSAAAGPEASGIESIISPRMQRTKPTLTRTTSASSNTTAVVEVGLQRNRSAHLAGQATAPTSTSPVPVQSPSPVLPSSTTTANPEKFSLGTHRPGVRSPSESVSATTAPQAHEWNRYVGSEHHSAMGAGAKEDEVPVSLSTAVSSTAPSTSASNGRPTSSSTGAVPSSTSSTPRGFAASSSGGDEDEDLDDIMGDLLGPYHPKTPLSDSAGSIDTPSSSHTQTKKVTATPTRAHSSSNGTGLMTGAEREAATIVTLELLELMLGNTEELPEIEVPTEQGDGAEQDDAAEVVEEVEASTPPVFPTTGLFSSPLIATPSRAAAAAAAAASPVAEDLPSMSEINELLSQQ